MAKLLVLHGPNLNLLGSREPEHYGQTSLQTINTRVVELVRPHGHTVECFQSNAEHELIDRIQAAAKENVAFIIFNPAALTHTSIALRDALAATEIPFVEVHLSNVYRREPFRHHSYFSDIALGVIMGFGAMGYELACQVALRQLEAG